MDCIHLLGFPLDSHFSLLLAAMSTASVAAISIKQVQQPHNTPSSIYLAAGPIKHLASSIAAAQRLVAMTCMAAWHHDRHNNAHHTYDTASLCQVKQLRA
jgi:hypothetical protein